MDLNDILAVADDIAETVVEPDAVSTDREAAWPEHGIRALLDAGLGGLVVPVEYGGLGHGLAALSRVTEILGRRCASTALCFGMHCVGSAVIAAKATAAQQEQFLAPIVEGKHLTTLALSEPGSGAHFYFPATELALGENGFVLNGVKTFVTNGGRADSYVLSAVAAGGTSRAGEFSCVIVPEGSHGMTWGQAWCGLGMRGNSSRQVSLEAVPLSPDHLLGAIGDQIWYVFEVVAPYFLSAMAGTYLGVAARALDEAVMHLIGREYEHSGATLAESPLLQHRVGSLWARVDATRRLVHSSAADADAGADRALLGILGAKAEAGSVAVEVSNEVLTLMGGRAFRDGSVPQRCLRDARAAHVMSPTTDLLYTWIGRTLLGLPILQE